jgi:hypothetical protein
MIDVVGEFQRFIHFLFFPCLITGQSWNQYFTCSWCVKLFTSPERRQKWIDLDVDFLFPALCLKLLNTPIVQFYGFIIIKTMCEFFPNIVCELDRRAWIWRFSPFLLSNRVHLTNKPNFVRSDQITVSFFLPAHDSASVIVFE